MSTEYNVVVFDKPNVDRLKVRSQHLAGIVSAVNSGVLTLGGAIYHDEAKTKFAGSTLQVAANSKQEVIDFLKTDVYYKEGIWDLDNAIIHPVGLAVRLPKKLDGVPDSFYNV
ncbi:hypothetical protein PICST_42277 [Scheffersomyces stipitis CBS 6054]|uniref:YCII-related domain-containing protein n=1 Tax=Scheffersomyces stipitis (strain ATCC 58785 / CBS 6054 / NBRC 10063 / NRRL Y-11545) TaxID=322104 RepID=A3LQH1_PICST|nr:hypothetical protein PICST_42277 [Scheffersomyces stipitis CBS 6054]ABN64681.2 hypothetical protein PICST_42277 [Scheffersomyces stipitis CBS 6054]KAG2736982.1 hypothetical protein G9P44_001072 [Scheffersomyces stipitis]